jgi:hypothetical protein
MVLVRRETVEDENGASLGLCRRVFGSQHSRQATCGGEEDIGSDPAAVQRGQLPGQRTPAYAPPEERRDCEPGR